MFKRLDLDSMSAEELREYIDRQRDKRNKSNKEWHDRNREKVREYQREYQRKRRSSLEYAMCQLKHWQKKVEELEKQLETEDKE